MKNEERPAPASGLFARIAPRYDLMNRLMTGFQDLRWRRLVIQLARLNPHASLLDLGAGTGDLTREALRRFPSIRVAAADLTLEMMRVGQRRGPLPFAAADALRLPFADASFDASVSGFLMRNVADLHAAMQEQFRVLKRGGRIVILDTTRPKKSILSPLIAFHMRVVIPALGALVTGLREEYNYLTASTENFLTAEKLAAHMAAVGFRRVGYERLMFGAIAIHWAEK
ncbi:MAG: Ubiquinone/menaquinone biosynthesis C-methyltransferase UbiE [Anaerolineales bacterium]|nr:Ubiquinone/menaquinone biosynthesis C-methyltransferase UbiE [Anaerolineales bacterium]